MPEFITKEQARDALLYLDDDLAFVPEARIEEISNAWNDEMRRLPPADVAPVVHGKWLTPKALIECSECGFGMFPDGYYFDHGECAHANESWFRPNYCPQCGARMDGGESNG